MQPILKLEHVGHTYAGQPNNVRAIDDVSLQLDPGQFHAVVGPSGCGKSTLLLCAGGLLQPTSGKVIVSGVEPYALAGDARAKLRARSIGFVFQQFHLVPFLSVRDNVLAPMMALDDPTPADLAARADALLERFGLSHRRDHLPAALSSGERQRTALARALLNEPKLLLADEPTGNLDSENAAIVLTHLREFAGAGGAVLLVTHDEQAVAKADTAIRLRGGRIVSGTA
jgi:putative ABC transport system ATP-binding protein